MAPPQQQQQGQQQGRQEQQQQEHQEEMAGLRQQVEDMAQELAQVKTGYMTTGALQPLIERLNVLTNIYNNQVYAGPESGAGSA